LSDTQQFAAFGRLLAPPTPQPAGYSTATATVTAPSIANGAAAFQTAGCHACHVLNQTTRGSPFTGQSNVTYHPLSDFAIHHMGATLTDGVTQGHASADMFRTAPLWGLGKRLFLLHDGRTSDLYTAILDHSSLDSEANTTVANFQALPTVTQQDILNYLRSL
jgi:CxxC motif-containing protein (DUF1111 family)